MFAQQLNCLKYLIFLKCLKIKIAIFNWRFLFEYAEDHSFSRIDKSVNNVEFG